MLKNDRFAVWVVGEVRDKKNGFYLPFIEHTKAAFHAAGAMIYNSAVLVTMLGSLPIRCGKQFASARKLGNTHQSVLVFCKGDPRKAARACGDIEVELPVDTEGE